MTDMESLKVIGITGISLYFIKELIIIIHMQIKNKKAPNELELKNISRVRIKEMYDVVTAKESGIPVIYNLELKTAINKLSDNIKAQTEVLKSMKK